MKKIFFAFLLILISAFCFAQNPLNKGGVQINAGFGFSDWGLPVYAGFDYGLDRDLTLGAEISYRSYKENWKYYDYNHSITGISGNLNFHFNRILRIPRDFNLYAGLNLGFYVWSSPGGYGGDHSSTLGLGLQVGGRYYFSPTFGINLEFGGGNAFSGGKIGISLKI